MDADTTQIDADNVHVPLLEILTPGQYPAPAARYLNGIISRFCSDTVLSIRVHLHPSVVKKIFLCGWLRVTSY